ncbi:MAG: S8 family serine peptidase [Chloroflexota bacterium]|nr:S8 family serine peptidase [Chloroflexota bacterium]
METDNHGNPETESTGCNVWARRSLILLVLAWISLVSFGAQGASWLAALFESMAVSIPDPAAMTAIQAIAIGIVLLPLALIWTDGRHRGIFQAWLAAAGFLLLMAPTRLLPSTASQEIILLQIGVSLACLLVFVWMARSQHLPRATWTGSMVSVAIALLFALIWIAWGAMGSALDVFLNLLLGLVFGLLASQIMSRTWLAALVTDPGGATHDLVTGGFVTGALVLIMASALSLNGLQLALMVALPALGWAAMGVTRLGPPPESSRRPALASLLGLAAAAPLVFVDTDGLVLEAMDPIAMKTLGAAFIAMVIAWLVGLVMILLSSRLARFRPRGAWAVPAIGLALAAGVLYLTGGQSGFHGDRLFVVLKDQADLSATADMADFSLRRQTVFDTLVQHASGTQAELRQRLDDRGIDYTSYYLVNAIEVDGGLLRRLWLARRPEVDRVLPSPRLRPNQSPLAIATGFPTQPGEPDWNLTSIGADRVWNDLGITGQGIVVGQSDSGAQFDHPELADGYRGGQGQHDYNWLDPWYGTETPVDHGGHGTHTLGSVLGNSVGVAPDATWFACTNLARNLGNPAFYLACMQFMLAPYPLGGDPFVDGDPARSAHVLNNSWGCPEDYEGCDPTSLQPALEALRAAGIFVVAAAGNSGPECSSLTDPIAIYDAAFSVGAIDREGHLATFSSRGPVTVDESGRVKPDIVAPGVDVLSAYPGDTYRISSGTSMAGPHVAGVVALMWSANPDLMGDIDATEAILIESSKPFSGVEGATLPNDDRPPVAEQLEESLSGGSGRVSAVTPAYCTPAGALIGVPNNLAGYGVVDAYQAVQMALELR